MMIEKMEGNMLQIKNINIKYNNKECIKNGHFIAYSSSITGIIGESGTGKSSLLYIIGMLSHQQYDYYYHHQLLKFNDKEKAKFRNEHVSFITQNSILIDTITVEKNIEFYLMQSNMEYTVDELLEKINLTDKKNAMPVSLSGGERQRVAIACAIAKDSDIILGDEITSALDEENKKLIMKILRECADSGKIVILVSHENDIIEECDRVYELDHLELLLKKDQKITEIHPIIKKKKKVKVLQMFDLLFYSNRRYNRRRIMFCLFIFLSLFICASILEYKKSHLTESFSIENVTKNKILVINDANSIHHDGKYGYGLRYFSEEKPLSVSDIDKLNQVEHIQKIYNYYPLPYSMVSGFGYYQDMELKVTRNGQIVNKKEDSDFYSDDFSIVPCYPEESLYHNEGVYINNNIAYMYNLEIGDELEIKLNIPYAMSKSYAYSSTEENQETSNEIYSYIGTQVIYKTQVIGIIEANSIFSNEIYIHYDEIEKMINQEVQNYKDGQNRINNEAYEGYSTIIDLKPFAKAVFVDKEENILGAINEIDEISAHLYEYNEYHSVLELKEEVDSASFQLSLVTYISVTLFVIGGMIIILFYLKKYKSTYLMMNFIGYDQKKQNKIYICHNILQVMIILCLAMLVYITASLPKIMSFVSHTSYIDILENIDNLYLTYMNYCQFTFSHFGFFLLLVVFVVTAANLAIKKYYGKQELVMWLRKK